MRHIIKSQQFSKEILFNLFKKADEIRENPKKSLKNKTMASLFYEPSTRTRLSFESAMLKLGGSVISTENAKEFSSVAKGESLEDTIRVISAYADVIVLRHDEEESSEKASKVSKIPIINAGDGKGQHPTQALLDIYTIYREFKKLEDLNIAIIGDLANGRTARSLCYLLGKFDNNKIIFISPDNLKMKNDIKDYLSRKNIYFKEETNLNNVIRNSDVVYMTRIQKERINQDDYEKANRKYVINEKNFELVKPNSRILHPLPHTEEINLPISLENKDKRVAYFRQAENGLYIRMALLDYILNQN